MRAVHQIIDHLYERGILDDAFMGVLMKRGIIVPRNYREDWEDFDWDDWYERATVLEQTDMDLRQSEVLYGYDGGYVIFPLPVRRSGKRQGKLPSGPQLPRLARRLRAQMAEWGNVLQPLGRIGQRLQNPRGRSVGQPLPWQDAVKVIDSADEEALAHAVELSLRRRMPSLKELWQSLTVDEYREVATDPKLRGPATSAYRMMLAADELSQVPRYRWVLARDEVADVWHLARAQKRLLRTFDRISQRSPALFATAMRRDYHWLAYWTSVMLYTARLQQDLTASFRADHSPQRQPPDEQGWMRALSCAAIVSPESVCVQYDYEMWCPREWDWRVRR